MASGTPVMFRKGGDATANYDWIDLTTGLGYKRFYAAASLISTGNVYYLDTKINDASSALGGVSSFNTALINGAVELNFDATFTKPATVGASQVIASYTVARNAGVTQVCTAFKVYHVNAAAVETELGTVAGKSHTAGGGAGETARELLTLDITKKVFGIGEKLRISILFTGNGAGAVYHDPASLLTATDTSTRTIGTDFTIDIPFVIDI